MATFFHFSNTNPINWSKGFPLSHKNLEFSSQVRQKYLIRKFALIGTAKISDKKI